MRSWLKGALLASFVFCASWIGAVSYWRATNRMPSTLDLFAWMAAVPLALLLAVWAARRIVAARSAPASAAAPAADAPATSAPPVVPSLAILASAVHTPHGASAQELARAVGEGRARADLDPELIDQDGFPLMSARVQLDGETFRDELDAWRRGAGLDDPRLTNEQWRALALGTTVAAELLMQAAAHPRLPVAAESADQSASLPMLRIYPSLASGWSEQQRTVAAGWLAALAVQAGWPDKRVQVSSLPAQPSAVLAQLASQAGLAGETVLAIVLGFGSQIGDAAVDDLARQGALFAAANPQGLIPGEAAAGLLVADAAQAAQFDGPATALQLASAARTPDQGSQRKPDAAHLRQLATTLLPEADSGAAVNAVFADTGHRSSKVLELMKFTGEALPHLDAGQDVKRLGGACGYCGHGEQAPLLAALALAHQHVLDTAGAALCVGNEDPLQHTAALVRPAAALS